jgi:hypothetical protein
MSKLRCVHNAPGTPAHQVGACVWLVLDHLRECLQPTEGTPHCFGAQCHSAIGRDVQRIALVHPKLWRRLLCVFNLDDQTHDPLLRSGAPWPREGRCAEAFGSDRQNRGRAVDRNRECRIDGDHAATVRHLAIRRRNERGVGVQVPPAPANSRVAWSCGAANNAESVSVHTIFTHPSGVAGIATAQLQVNQAQAQAAAAVQVQVPRIASRVAACTSWRAILLGDLLYPSVGRSVARSVAIARVEVQH